MSKISVIAKHPVKEGSKEAFIEATAALMEAVKDEPGTELYILNWDNKDQNVALMYELYTDKAALGAHSKSEAMATFMATIADLLGAAPELNLARPTAAKGVEL